MKGNTKLFRDCNKSEQRMFCFLVFEEATADCCDAPKRRFNDTEKFSSCSSFSLSCSRSRFGAPYSL